ncbi:16S rRNA (adenine(1518)-N(6)/adenine(1519)-N(6))-dimethyltransferase RsmA [Actinomyces wuliandei]|uniref:16S rRNA (adenine(1518)-N(6)/adenine(1519)-N(6))- dimethyltransferase RsmA n=1 Tax=Actinomyces wuliandei TaxID=2057743 RepID=UPI001FA9A27E|nr:16S rRNA (adenine(1518)-N(6)/adenine(1519)-N(6))-dimethyltransferase RsmA [Actinomyces wuliandei]
MHAGQRTCQDSGRQAGRLLGPTEVRSLCRDLGIRPAKALGQNFVHDAGTVRRIVRTADVQKGEATLEVGPGLGSLTLALLEAGAQVVAVEVDPVLAGALPQTVASHMPWASHRLKVVTMDALSLSGPEHLEGLLPTRMVANLPYNVAVPVLLTALARLPSLETLTVMVQAEVADRLAALPGSRTYGAPSAKAAWYASVRRAGAVSRGVFWPVPRVDSALVHLRRREPPATRASRDEVFAVIDAAFAQRRKTLRQALAPVAGSAAGAESALRAAGIDPGDRGERLDVMAFATLTQHLRRVCEERP